MIGFDALTERGRWKVEFFCSPESSNDRPDAAGLVPIRSLVRERKESVDPSGLGNAIVNYIGLEHIQSMTGELVDYFTPRIAKEVKSRSKVFKEEDVLFGRLRPSLNKVMVARGSVCEGICSTEIFVLIPDKTVVLPMVLRYLLSSHYIQKHALRLQSGTALPRMNLDDLLDIEVPVPPLKVQRKLEAELNRRFGELTELRKRVEQLPEMILQDFLKTAEAASSQ
ncbi:MAG: restriction endonuclease subunit S [Acidobacteriaceae bacterium]